MKTQGKLYARWIFLSILRVVVTVLPLAITFLVRRDEYFTAPGQSLKLTIGGVLCLVLLVLAALGKLRALRRIVAVFGLLALSWLFSAILKDLTFLLFMWLIGEVCDLIVAPFALYARSQILVTQTAMATAQAVRAGVQTGGRV